MDLAGTFTVTLDGYELADDPATPETRAWVSIRFQGREYVLDDDTGKMVFPHKSHRKAAPTALPTSFDLPTDVATGTSTDLGYKMTVLVGTGRNQSAVGVATFNARAAGSTWNITQLFTDTPMGPIEDLAGLVERAEDAAAAALAVPASNDTIIAGRVNDSTSATRAALSATYGRVTKPLTVSYISDSQGPATTYVYGVTTHWAGVARALLGHRYTDGVVAGIGGQTSTQIAARIGTITSAGQSICIIHAGVNDLAAGTAASVVTANIQTMINACRAAGITPVVLTNLPSTAFNTTTIRLQHAKVNTFIRELPQTQGVLSIDICAAVIDWSSTSGAWIAGYTADGIHPNETGHVIIGQTVADGLAPLVAGFPAPLLSQAGTNASLLSPNPGMTGSGGTAGAGVTGTIPASWTVNGTTTTAASVEARTDGVGGNWLKLDVTSGSPQLFIQNTAVGVDWSVGDTVWAEAEIQMTTTPTNFRGFSFRLDFWNAIGTVNDLSLYMPPSTVLPVRGRPGSFVLRTKPTVVPAGTARLQYFLVPTQSVASHVGTYRIGRAAIRKSA